MNALTFQPLSRILSFLFGIGVAFGQPHTALVPHALDPQLQSAVLDKHHVGFSLYDMNQRRFVYGKNQDHHFTPASNTKVFTLFSALTVLGDSIPGLAYIETPDSLIFWGTGDPSFLHPELDNGRVFEFLKSTDKPLYYAPTKTQEPVYRAGWAIDDYDYAYQPEISDFPIYGNLVRFHSQEGKLISSPTYFQQSLSMTLSDTTDVYRIQREIDRNVFHIRPSAAPQSYRTKKPFRTADTLVAKLLTDTLHKKVHIVDKELPANPQILYSIPTRQALREMMLPSDNFIAEQLHMLAAFTKYRTFQTSDLRDFMQETYDQTLTDTIQLRDGSGLSSYNKITPRSMVDLLVMIADHLPDPAQLHYLFPAGGLEGTLKNVYPTPGGQPFVWAKTGTIHSVHCQSGYLISKAGNRYAFSFLNNNFFGSAAPIREEMVRVITYIYENL